MYLEFRWPRYTSYIYTARYILTDYVDKKKDGNYLQFTTGHQKMSLRNKTVNKKKKKK